MFAALFAVACFVSATDPAPLPDRWMLKLLPDNLLPLPDRIYDVTWYNRRDSRSSLDSWVLWAEFRRANRDRPAEAVVTLIGHGTPWTVRPTGRVPPPQGRRSVPLAVHGPLVEFDGRLYTATLRTGKIAGDDVPNREFLHLGSAVELKNHVWYKAGTVTATDGKMVTVEEWRLDFKDDPRIAAEGIVTVRHHSRVFTKPDGESFSADLRFKAEPPNDRSRARVITFLPPHGRILHRELPYLQLGNDPDMPDETWMEGQDRLVLYPDTDGHKRVPDRPALVQPPTKSPK